MFIAVAEAVASSVRCKPMLRQYSPSHPWRDGRLRRTIIKIPDVRQTQRIRFVAQEHPKRNQSQPIAHLGNVVFLGFLAALTVSGSGGMTKAHIVIRYNCAE
jgi:hypothetical protein